MSSSDRILTFVAVIATLTLFAGRSAMSQQLEYLPTITVSAGGKDDPPQGPQSSLARVLGKCEVLFWVTADGYVRLAQVRKSSGYARIDEACWRGALGQRMEPAKTAAGPIASWAILPAIFEVHGSLAAKPPQPMDRPDAAIAPLAPNQSIPILAGNYPAGALARLEQGNSVVHVENSETGEIIDLKIAQNSGSAELDDATLKAIRAARFSPAIRNHEAVASDSDVAVRWMLPQASGNPGDAKRP